MGAAEKLEPEKILDAFKRYEDFCRSMLDAYALVDLNGKVLKLNQMLCQLTNLKSKQIIKKDSLDDIINLSINSKQISVSDLIQEPGPTRLDEVRGSTDQSKDLNLIIGVYPFKGDDESPMGAFILIRDVTAETHLQGKFKDVHDKSITDPLTGLFTRGYFEDYLNLYTKTVHELPKDADQRVMSLVMIDIDFFKKVNDVHGHQAGDFVLQKVAHVMRKNFRKNDIVCRYGGEEFLVILPSTGVTGANFAAEKLRKNIEAEHIEFEGTHIPTTISIGVAEIDHDRETYVETMGRADAALYEAKEGGRNCVKIAKP